MQSNKFLYLYILPCIGQIKIFQPKPIKPIPALCSLSQLTYAWHRALCKYIFKYIWISNPLYTSQISVELRLDCAVHCAILILIKVLEKNCSPSFGLEFICLFHTSLKQTQFTETPVWNQHHPVRAHFGVISRFPRDETKPGGSQSSSILSCLYKIKSLKDFKTLD